MFKMMDGSPPTQIPPSNFLYRLDKLAYSTPPPVSNDPANNECRIIEYRGAKLASFSIDGDVMICLPQAFDLFLKHLVGGLHTVYTKLKRLNITPVVCNVEQVRILRGLGAIQPGVNRCKLLTRKQFDVLYEDCTTASRPGRPPKRSLPISLHHHLHGVHATGHPLDILKRQKLDNGLPFGYDGLATSQYLMAHHPAFLPTSLAMANHLTAMSRPTDHHETSDNEQQSPSPTIAPHHHVMVNGKTSPHNSEASHEAGSSSQSNMVSSDEEGRGKENGDDDDDMSGNEVCSYSNHKIKHTAEKNQSDSHQGSFSVPVTSNSTYRSSPSNPDSMSFHRALSSASDILSSQGPSSMETLLTNIQGLLKVAADNARQQEKHNHLQSAELKLELLREKELRESLGKQLAAEQKRAAILLKRLKKEKKARRRLAEQIGVESTTHVENGEVPSTPTEPVTKVNGDSQRLKNEAFQDSEPKKHEKVDQDSNYEVSMTSEKASLVGYNSH
ncbi:dachshund homolog 1-like isoform X2 [Apostichopus japonicus]|uniref:dachshund homolog 1-like isoform X2 n=1 Tax=Stichopus japonicus TaxID=307972 RepID=UPI003AB44619